MSQDWSGYCRELQQTLHREVPLTAHMGVEVTGYDGETISVEAALAPNINIHGTAFGGSLFSIAAVTCWGNLHLLFEREGLKAHSVLGTADIAYNAPVRDRIRIRCRLPEAEILRPFLDKVRSGAKARLTLSADILTDEGQAASYTAHYVAFL